MFKILKNCQMLSKVAALFTFPLAVYEGSSYSTSSPILTIHLVEHSHLVGVKWYLMLLICTSLMTVGVDSLFQVLIGHFLGEMSVQILHPLSKWIICYFIIEL